MSRQVLVTFLTIWICGGREELTFGMSYTWNLKMVHSCKVIHRQKLGSQERPEALVSKSRICDATFHGKSCPAAAWQVCTAVTSTVCSVVNFKVLGASNLFIVLRNSGSGREFGSSIWLFLTPEHLQTLLWSSVQDSFTKFLPGHPSSLHPHLQARKWSNIYHRQGRTPSSTCARNDQALVDLVGRSRRKLQQNCSKTFEHSFRNLTGKGLRFLVVSALNFKVCVYICLLCLSFW